MEKNIILLSSHFYNNRIKAKYERITNELDVNKYGILLLFNKDEETIDIVAKDVKYYVTDSNSIFCSFRGDVDNLLISSWF